jgi:RNA polymerase sigma-70 factor (ECF subfamily)
VTPSLRAQSTTRSFERLYRAHVGDVYRYALAVSGNRADAEDIAQTTFMNAYRALEGGERPVKPRNWLIAITHNVCRQRFRQTASRPHEVAFDDDVAETIVPSDDTPTAADIKRALGELALNQREALVMRELEGRSYADIAEILGLSVSSVETLLFRARRALREQLEGALSCSEAEAALSLQLDGRLSRTEAGLLRSHLRACETCRRLARSQRAQRKGVRALAAVPLPPGLASVFGGASGVGAAGGAGAGITVAAKVAAATVAAAVVGGGGYTIVQHETATPHPHPAAARATTRTVEPPAPAPKTKAAQQHQPRVAGVGRSHAPEHHPPSTGSAAVSATAPDQPASRPADPPHTAPSHQAAPTPKSPSHKPHAAKTSKGKHAAKHVHTSHAAALPATAHACREQAPAAPTETLTDVTTTTAVATTAATAVSCPKPQGRGKGSSNHP